VDYVQYPIAATQQNRRAAEDGWYDQYGHLASLLAGSYATSVHNIKNGKSMSVINMAASLPRGTTTHQQDFSSL
jgi:hypothetical protein